MITVLLRTTAESPQRAYCNTLGWLLDRLKASRLKAVVRDADASACLFTLVASGAEVQGLALDNETGYRAALSMGNNCYLAAYSIVVKSVGGQRFEGGPQLPEVREELRRLLGAGEPVPVRVVAALEGAVGVVHDPSM